MLWMSFSASLFKPCLGLYERRYIRCNWSQGCPATPTPTRGREVTGGVPRGTRWDQHGGTCDPPWEHELPWCVVKSECSLLPPPPRRFQAYLQCVPLCVCHFALLLWTSPSLEVGCQHCLRGRRQSGKYLINTLLTYQRSGVELSSHCQPASMSPRPHLHTDRPLCLSENIQGHLFLQLWEGSARVSHRSPIYNVDVATSAIQEYNNVEKYNMQTHSA